MSKREILQEDIKNFLQENNISCLSNQIEISRGKYRSLSFINKSTDVEIKIFNDKFFVVKWNGSVSNLPFIGQEKLSSIEDLKTFVKNFT